MDILILQICDAKYGWSMSFIMHLHVNTVYRNYYHMEGNFGVGETLANSLQIDVW